MTTQQIKRHEVKADMVFVITKNRKGYVNIEHHTIHTPKSKTGMFWDFIPEYENALEIGDQFTIINPPHKAPNDSAYYIDVHVKGRSGLRSLRWDGIYRRIECIYNPHQPTKE